MLRDGLAFGAFILWLNQAQKGLSGDVNRANGLLRWFSIVAHEIFQARKDIVTGRFLGRGPALGKVCILSTSLLYGADSDHSIVVLSSLPSFDAFGFSLHRWLLDVLDIVLKYFVFNFLSQEIIII